jgi:hypothetical protein
MGVMANPLIDRCQSDAFGRNFSTLRNATYESTGIASPYGQDIVII